MTLTEVDRGTAPDGVPIECWPTSRIKSALHTDDAMTWQRIVAAIRRDPYGRTARQVEEVLGSTRPLGIGRAIADVLARTRADLEEGERAAVSRLVRALVERSGLQRREFVSRIGVSDDYFDAYASGVACPPQYLMVRMERLSERFARMRRAERVEPA